MKSESSGSLRACNRKMDTSHPNSMKRWKDNWDAISPIFKFSTTVQNGDCYKNAIESEFYLPETESQRYVFQRYSSIKTLYLATFEATKKWTSTIRNWAQVYGELSIMYEGRLPE